MITMRILNLVSICAIREASEIESCQTCLLQHLWCSRGPGTPHIGTPITSILVAQHIQARFDRLLRGLVVMIALIVVSPSPPYRTANSEGYSRHVHSSRLCNVVRTLETADIYCTTWFIESEKRTRCQVASSIGFASACIVSIYEQGIANNVLADIYRTLFKFGVFNAVQSKCFGDVCPPLHSLIYGRLTNFSRSTEETIM